MSDEFAMFAGDRSQAVPSKKSGTDHIDLTANLELSNARARLWYLSPGDTMSYHRQTVQEELYFVIDGPGRIRIGDEIHTVPENGAVRVPPETPRQLLNDSDDEEHAWFVIGVPAAENDGVVLSDE